MGTETEYGIAVPGQTSANHMLASSQIVNAYLNASGDPNRTMSRGAAWDRVLADITNKQNVVVYVSSLADGSGWNDHCTSSDSSVALNDPQIGLWSAARWSSYLADRYGLEKNGENPGRSDTSSYGLSMLDTAVAQGRSCGFQGVMWAHDADLYSGSPVSLADYSQVIRGN